VFANVAHPCSRLVRCSAAHVQIKVRDGADQTGELQKLILT
jgi:hypothetical protein